MNDQNKNLIIATALSLIVLLGWFWLFPPVDPATLNPPEASTPGAQLAEGAPATDAGATAQPAPAAEPVADAPRIAISTPRLSGSLSLLGGRIDQLTLGGTDPEQSYRQTLEDDAGPVTLLSPVGEDHWYYTVMGWAAVSGVNADQVPGANTLWAIASGGELTPETPVSLVWDNGAGLTFRREISVDADYMFTVTDSVENKGAAAVTIAPYGFIARQGHDAGAITYIQHQGVIGMTDGTLKAITYKKMDGLDADAAFGGLSESTLVAENGWLGFTDKYWMTALIPQAGTAFTATARYNEATDIYRTETVYAPVTVEAGAAASTATRLFAGAKEWETIRHYQNDEGVDRFIDSIDWGWFFFFTKPIFWLLHAINAQLGNMGWSIIGLTLIIKAIVFPLARKSYVSMARMKELQPEMEALKERFGDDRTGMQKEVMELYKRRKVNPASGCLPILVQIPIFFSLYKVIFNTIELRHAAWFGWIQDLSAPDPSSILNLFGLLPFATPEPGTALAIVSLGVLPILLGISMWFQQKLNPAPTDPTQAAVFAWMPWIFMFMLGSFASGLVLYWITNNVITFVQQYLIMWSHGHPPDLFGNIRSGFKRKPAAANSTKAPKKR